MERGSIPLGAFSRLVGANWVVLQRDGRIVRIGRDRADRGLDPALFRAIERGRLLRLGPKELKRWPRTATSDLESLLVFVDRERPSNRIAAGLSHVRALDLASIEPLVTSLLDRDETADDPAATDAVRRLRAATHDLRHLLTVASLEIERASLETDEALAVENARAALEDARRLCEGALAPEPAAARRERHELRLVLESAARHAALASDRGDRVGIRVSCEAGILVAVDRGALERALRNLVLNAIEASPDGGRVEVAASCDGGGGLRVFVRDDGRGISAGDLPDLLRAGRSGSGGSGYGTESVRACARDLGGTLRVRSRPLAGTEILLELPGAGARA